MAPSLENQLSFRNHQNSVFKYKELTGFCWGHATVGQRMSQLSVFNPAKKLPYEEGSRKWLRHYKKVIDDLVHNNAREVVGFANLNSFSKHPALEEYIALQVSKTWAKQAASIANLHHFIRLKGQEKVEQKFVKRVKEYLKFGIAPIVVKADEFPYFGGSHVIIVYKYEERDDGTVRFYIRDNSAKSDDNAKMDLYFTIDPNSEGSELNLTLIDRHFNRDIVKQTISMKLLCEKIQCSKRN